MREINRQARELRTADEDATDAFTTEKTYHQLLRHLGQGLPQFRFGKHRVAI